MGRCDLKKAKYWYKKSAEKDDAGAIYNLGALEFLQSNYKQALPYFEKSANLNNPFALNMLGIYYSENIIFEKNDKKALEYFLKAAKQNNRDAQFNIGQAYYNAEGVDQNYQQAFNWYSQSAAQDYSLAKIQLAEMYFSGKGINKDVTKAIKIIEPLAKQGDKKAQSNLKWYMDHQN